MFRLWVAVARSSGVLKAAGAGFAGLGVGSTAAGAEVGLQGAFLLGSSTTTTGAVGVDCRNWRGPNPAGGALMHCPNATPES